MVLLVFEAQKDELSQHRYYGDHLQAFSYQGAQIVQGLNLESPLCGLYQILPTQLHQSDLAQLDGQSDHHNFLLNKIQIHWSRFLREQVCI